VLNKLMHIYRHTRRYTPDSGLNDTLSVTDGSRSWKTGLCIGERAVARAYNGIYRDLRSFEIRFDSKVMCWFENFRIGRSNDSNH